VHIYQQESCRKRTLESEEWRQTFDYAISSKILYTLCKTFLFTFLKFTLCKTSFSSVNELRCKAYRFVIEQKRNVQLGRPVV